MNAIIRLWQSLHTLASGLDRLANLVHRSADALEERLELDDKPLALNGHIEPRVVKARK
jgi:hypothetical protein